MRTLRPKKIGEFVSSLANPPGPGLNVDTADPRTDPTHTGERGRLPARAVVDEQHVTSVS